MSDLSGLERRRWLLEQLRFAVARLASSADDQLQYLRGLGSGEQADELALELDDLREVAIAEGLITQRQEALLRSLDEQLDSMSGADKSAIRCGPPRRYALARSGLRFADGRKPCCDRL
jgi:hypothetical protein